MINNKDILRVAFYVLFVVIVIAFLLLLRPFYGPLIIGGVTAFVFYPAYIKLRKLVHSQNLAAFLIVLILILLFTIPISIIGTTLVKETRSLYLFSLQNIDLHLLQAKDCNIDPCGFSDKLKSTLLNDQVFKYVESGLAAIANMIIAGSRDFLLSLPSVIVNILLFFFVIFFVLRDGHIIYGKVFEIIPMKNEHKLMVIKQINDTLNAVIFGSILTALIQGGLGALGFFMFGIKAPIFWGLIMMLFAFIPFIGTGLVWFPASLFLIYESMLTGGSPLRGILLLVYCAIFVGSLDNFIKPKIIGDKAKIHPLLIFIGVFGGLYSMGLKGVIIGPVIMGLLVSMIKIYRLEKDYFIKA